MIGDEAIQVLRELPEITEAYHVTHLRCYGKDGQQIEIDVLDAGPAPPSGERFTTVARATTDVGEKNTSSRGATLKLALRTLRLFELR